MQNPLTPKGVVSHQQQQEDPASAQNLGLHL
jgi:hypothetical protein